MNRMVSLFAQTKLLDGRAKEQQRRNRDYLMELTVENLLFSHYSEAGLNGSLNYTVKAHGGWDSPTSQIRGMFVGHWLSAAARLVHQTQDMQLKAKADFIVEEIGRCQQHNGNGWAFSIPEKYLYFVKAGKNFWAPQYVCHKNMMGLLEMFLFAGNKQALDILLLCADWFYAFTSDITRENMDNMMKIQETGGMMEFWADLYDVTKEEKHLELVRRYEKPQLFEPVYRGEDVLTNCHANTTIPEIHGCARAYEVTGEERYRKIVENYWDLAVTKRGTYASGGQTCGEVWTPMQVQSTRLGQSNQEHCVVYNMIRLADYLYRWTGDAKYADYIERNIHNGLYAQAFWESRSRDTFCEREKDFGTVAYYLPMAAGSSKKWGGKTEDFWCCYGTVVQANSKFREYVYFQNQEQVTVAQYLASDLDTEINGARVRVEQTETDLEKTRLQLGEDLYLLDRMPEFWAFSFAVKADGKTDFTMRFRLPWWLADAAVIYVNKERYPYREEEGYACVARQWAEDEVVVLLPKKLTCYPLADQPAMVAFLDGPVLLAGITDQQTTLYGEVENPAGMLQTSDEREWGQWMLAYQTVNQQSSIKFIPVNQIGRETYTLYFPVKAPGQ